MKKIVFVVVLVILAMSCKKRNINFSEEIINGNKVNSTFLSAIKEPEKALLLFYLFAYGNECSSKKEESITNIKCKLLNELNIKNECDSAQIQFFKKWISTNFLMNLKLKKCPQLPIKGTVKNTIEKIVLKRISDTISITIKVKGLNELQEKYWEIEQEDFYIIKNKTLQKINE